MSNFVLPYRIPDHLIQDYIGKEPEWPLDISKVTFYRTYSRKLANGKKERFSDVIRRCVEGSISLMLRQAGSRGRLEKIINRTMACKVDTLAVSMFQAMFAMKFLPPGRGLWTMGTAHSWETSSVSLNNCAMISTKDLDTPGLTPFGFLMDVSMLGAGCGFDTRGAGSAVISGPTASEELNVYRIPDSREGWVESVDLLIRSYLNGSPEVTFDYTLIRPAGAPIRGFGGVASGPEPLLELHGRIRSYLQRDVGSTISVRSIVDIMNAIGACVVAGNVRRSSLIAIGDHNDQEFSKLKDYQLPENSYRMAIGGYSNNSVVLNSETTAEQIDALVNQTVTNGEPGYLFLDRCITFGRMCEPPKPHLDKFAVGTNPCGEMTLESGELCNLVEVFPVKFDNVDDINEWAKVFKLAYMYAKSVTFADAHNPVIQERIKRNRRLGISISGIAMLVEQMDPKKFHSKLDTIYRMIRNVDVDLSTSIGVPTSNKITTVKPSGTVSLVAGVTAGVHYPMGRYYLKRMRIAANNPLLKWAQASNIPTEPAVVNFKYNEETGGYDPVYSKDTWIIEFPVKIQTAIRARDQVSVSDQIRIICNMQSYWSDNQVSATVTFNDYERNEIKETLLEACQRKDFPLKSISFIRNSSTDYPQMPEEALTEEQYNSRVAAIKPVDITEYLDDDVTGVGESGCTNDNCTL